MALSQPISDTIVCFVRDPPQKCAKEVRMLRM
jgi:hypothetical protein